MTLALRATPPLTSSLPRTQLGASPPHAASLAASLSNHSNPSRIAGTFDGTGVNHPLLRWHRRRQGHHSAGPSLLAAHAAAPASGPVHCGTCHSCSLVAGTDKAQIRRQTQDPLLPSPPSALPPSATLLGPPPAAPSPHAVTCRRRKTIEGKRALLKSRLNKHAHAHAHALTHRTPRGNIMPIPILQIVINPTR